MQHHQILKLKDSKQSGKSSMYGIRIPEFYNISGFYLKIPSRASHFVKYFAKACLECATFLSRPQTITKKRKLDEVFGKIVEIKRV